MVIIMLDGNVISLDVGDQINELSSFTFGKISKCIEMNNENVSILSPKVTYLCE